MKQQLKRRKIWCVMVIIFVAVLIAGSPAEARAPAGKTYFVTALGLGPAPSGAYEISAGCLQFTDTEICVGEECGVWSLAEVPGQTKSQFGFEFEFDFIDDESGLAITLMGKGQVERRGKRSSLAAVGHGMEPISGQQMNMTIAGREVRPKQCLDLAEEFEARNNQ